MANKIDLDQWYTPAQAAEKLSENSGKKIDPSYIRTLARYGVLTPLKINSRLSLYPKAEVDTYVVEDRGDKLEHKRASRAKRQTAQS